MAVSDESVLEEWPAANPVRASLFDHPRARVVGAWLAHSQRRKSRNPESHRTNMFDYPRTRVVGAWLAHSRRQKSRNPENHRAGKRSRKYICKERTKEKCRKSAGKCRKVQCHSRAFPTPSRGHPNHGIREHFIYFIISVRETIGSPASPKMLLQNTT